MAVGIAQALRYIHERDPPIIHRDLKSKNILLSDTLEAKIIDFGVSRSRKDGFMTAGVGTPYWIAPEILEGKRYTEQADIYSFGVVLSELDTCKMPFSDVATAEGKKPKPFQILQWVLDVMRVSGLLAILAATSTMAQDYTITFRSLKEEDSASSSLPSDSSFVFDGTNSDIAQQLYIRHQAGDTSAAVAINSIPTARAVLWDSGFGISPEGDPVQIWTIGDYTMADIAVPQDDITQILNVSRCVVDTFDDSGATNFLGTMWSTGGDSSMTPHIRLRDHTWTEPTTGISYSVYAVHTVSSADDPTWNQCPANDGYSSLIVPCHKRSEFTDAEMAAMTKPTGTAWVTTWLKDEFAVEDSGFEELLLIPIILVVIAAMEIGWFCWKRSTMLKREQSSSCDFDVVSPNYLDVAAHQQALRHTVTTTSHGPSISSHPDDYESAGSNQTFKILLHSQHLHGNRIPYENLLFQTELSKGASGEVWICRYGGQQVAVKKLLHTKDQKAKDVQVFAEEIELTASLLHPHIVKFIGVAWNSLSNLSMVLEYVPRGNLRDYLHKNSDLLSWARDRIYVAVAVAEALEYLHSRSPAIIQRDLKSNNILLTESLEPKLIDFGVSRGMMDTTMTAGVGTPYWTAPEILEGDRYTEKADIYSFGVVLSELDTGRIPYFDAVEGDGTRLMPFQIPQEVMSVGMADHDTISLRSLASVSSSSSSSFEFDGTNSDIAQQLFIRHQAGDAGQRVNLTRIPAAVSDRLDPLNVKFKELPGLVQRAVLWDTGFAISPGNNPVQIWTMQNYTMADIAVPKADVSYVDCTYLNSDNFEDPGASGYMGMMWSTGGEPDMIPLIRLREHTIEFTDEYMAANTTIPTGTEWVTTWLKQEFGQDKHQSQLLLFSIVLSVIIALTGIGLGWLGCRQRSKPQKEKIGGQKDAKRSSQERSISISSPKSLRGSAIQSLHYERAGSNKTLQILLGSEHLEGKRIPYDSLVFDSAISKGASGEVWVCEYNGQKVAVKRLLQRKKQKAESVQTFAKEIELSASLVHPSIVEFIGVAWNSLDNLVMALEFLPTGSLKDFLEKNSTDLSWARDKIYIAIGIARALVYLHARTPPLIHRDLKSSNILLTDSLEPKIIDFGVSRGLIDLTMTGGVGTPYWTAPEILEGKHYTEKADIYSLGVVLSELDTVRSLESTSSSILPSDDSFVFDGTNSDIARQLYIRHNKGDVGDQVNFTSIPEAIAARLDQFNIKFNDLPGLVQRAVLWDSGFAISPTNEAVQIRTINNFTMAELAVPKDEVSGADCTFKNCSQPNGVTAHYTQYCTGDQMLSVSRCVVDIFEDKDAVNYLGAMWSRGGDPDMAPLIRLREHSWTDPSSNMSYSVYAVHTVPRNLAATWDQCRPDKEYASLAVPCYRSDKITVEMDEALTTPQGTAWVTTWLDDEFAEKSGQGLGTLVLVLIIVGGVLALGLFGLGWYCCCRRAKRREEKPALGADDFDVESPVYMTPELAKPPTASSGRLTQQSSVFSQSSIDFESAGSNRTLEILLNSPHLQGRRIPYESVTFKNTLSKGVNGEVWVCEYNGYMVAVKRLLQGNQKAETVQAFAEEIELSASLVHPSIVEFIGVAWNSLNNLVMVLEFFPRGNLQNYLHKNSDLLSWARDKIQMAVAIAHALQYLHDRSSPIIHRDLKSNNILLTEKLKPKLIDFGVSRRLVELTMTAGIGTPYWTAPEILEGKRYTEQADIYSFGVVLSELDTGKIPYYDALTEGGGKAKPFQILQDVVDGFALALPSSMAQGHTISLRSLESNSSFVFDGTHSDIAQQLYIRHKAGDTDTKVSLDSVPVAVANRLSDLNIQFSDLPGLVQRAVLWDTGFALSPSNAPVQVWTMQDYTMADIAVPKDEVSGEGCTFKNCTQPNDELAYYTLICSGAQMVNVSRCVADTFVDSAATSYLGSMWSVGGGDPSMVPHIRLRDHSWVDPVTEVSYSVYAVHTTSVADDPAWNVCPADDGYGALTVPCHRRDEFTDKEMAAMNTPTGSAWVTTWLEEEFAEGSGFDLLLLVPIILGAVVLIAAIGFGWVYWKRKDKSKIEDTVSTTCDLAAVSPQYMSGSTVPLPKYATLKILLGSQHLTDKRMPYESIVYLQALSKGSSGEVWLCEHNGQQVAIKRLLQNKQQKAENVQAFAEEIELTASLDHPHIVRFIGVAWNTLNNLVMVLEYVPMGSLQNYLDQNADLLSWARDKIHMAVGVAQALEYLHSHTPSLIHRDLKSTNILLTHMLEPKLIDFGVSRGSVELTMTAGVGTPYWTAPEILEGKRYTEQADIYSFGVVLS
ncbi:hypothetical protein JG688_00002483 [Phytophthora aleatoria]|uniref:Protein kinase domain-containing protein n=1 Tax=Phytophthora aleatoria TaxID=2496075 RepID=A0A8J5JAZ6_9STRA|nr:hypothetical protein JG688_00002483 [Phytophthora aleatoria]